MNDILVFMRRNIHLWTPKAKIPIPRFMYLYLFIYILLIFIDDVLQEEFNFCEFHKGVQIVHKGGGGFPRFQTQHLWKMKVDMNSAKQKVDWFTDSLHNI